MPNKLKYSPIQISEMQSDFDSGLTWMEVSKKYGINNRTIIKYVDKGIFTKPNKSERSKARHKKRFKKVEDAGYFADLQRDYDSGMSWRQVSIKYKKDHKQILKYKKRGLLGGTQRDRKLTAKLSHTSESYFKNIRAYWTEEKRNEHSKRMVNFFTNFPEKHSFHKNRNTIASLNYPERIAYRFLEGLGIGFQSQYPIGRYWVDFLVDGRLVIEVDGEFWHKDRKEYDATRDIFLESLGYHVIRIPAKYVYENLHNLFKSFDLGISLDLGKIKSEKIIASGKFRKQYYCPCGTEINVNASRCISCYELELMNRFISKFSSVDLIKIAIETMPLKRIARIYGVSVPAIKNNCGKLGIVLVKWSPGGNPIVIIPPLIRVA